MHANAVLVTSSRVIYFRRFNFPPKAAVLKPTSWYLKWSKVLSWCNICVFPYHWPHSLLLSKRRTSNPYIACLWTIHPHALNHLVPMGIGGLPASLLSLQLLSFSLWQLRCDAGMDKLGKWVDWNEVKALLGPSWPGVHFPMSLLLDRAEHWTLRSWPLSNFKVLTFKKALPPPPPHPPKFSYATPQANTHWYQRICISFHLAKTTFHRVWGTPRYSP